MRWVKLTLPPEVRARCWLRIDRFTSRSLAGTERTLVAVGTDSDAAMFCAIRAAAPRRGAAAGSADAADTAGGEVTDPSVRARSGGADGPAPLGATAPGAGAVAELGGAPVGGSATGGGTAAVATPPGT